MYWMLEIRGKHSTNSREDKGNIKIARCAELHLKKFLGIWVRWNSSSFDHWWLHHVAISSCYGTVCQIPCFANCISISFVICVPWMIGVVSLIGGPDGFLSLSCLSRKNATCYLWKISRLGLTWMGIHSQGETDPSRHTSYSWEKPQLDCTHICSVSVRFSNDFVEAQLTRKNLSKINSTENEGRSCPSEWSILSRKFQKFLNCFLASSQKSSGSAELLSILYLRLCIATLNIS